MHFLLKFINPFRKQINPVLSLRQELAMWGIDTTDLSDQEIEDGVKRFSSAVADCGITTKQLFENFNIVAQAGYSIK